MRFAGVTLRRRRSAIGQSCASPPVNRMAMRRPLASASAWIFVLRPPRERPTACFCSPLSARCRAVRFYMRRVDHLRVCGAPVLSKLSEQIFPDATPCPAHKAVIDRRRRTISFWAIAPAAAALDPAGHAAVVCSLDAAHIRRQMRFNPCPLLVAQLEQIPAHRSSPNTNQYRIVRAERLMSSDPSRLHAAKPWRIVTLPSSCPRLKTTKMLSSATPPRFQSR